MDYKISMAAARVNAGLTQSDVASRMRISKATVVSWERGYVMPKLAQFKLFCEICSVPEDLICLPRNLK